MSAGDHHVVIIGGGFGGLYAAKTLGKARTRVTLLDRRNFHLFQPLLYQVATGGLSPGDIASPLRDVLKHHRRISVLHAEVMDILPQERKVALRDRTLIYDTLIVAAGMKHNYFGHEDWIPRAPGLKSVEDALEIRRRILLAFEAAELEEDEALRRTWLRFVVIGGGPTGVELAGAVAELAHGTLKGNFRQIDPSKTEIFLLESSGRILPPYPPKLSAEAVGALEKLGVEVKTGARVEVVEDNKIAFRQGAGIEEIETRTVLWAAGMKASSLGEKLARGTGVELDPTGRVVVESDLSLPGRPEIFVIGDLAHFAHQDNQPLPGVAPVAMQQGHYVAKLITERLKGQTTPAFRYVNKGSLAVIGRHAAVADLGVLRFAGWPAWLAWLFVHIAYLIEYDNKLLVLIQWGWNYFTRKRGARLVTGRDSLPAIGGGRGVDQS